MQSDPATPSPGNNPGADSVPPPLPASEPPPLANPLQEVPAAPPPLSPPPKTNIFPTGKTVATLMNLYIGLFLIDAVFSLVDDSTVLLFNSHAFTGIRGIIFVFSLLSTILVYCLMGLTPLLPRRLFLSLTLFNPVASLAVIPCFIYFFDRLQVISWATSLCECIFGLGILCWVQGDLKFHWPLVGGELLRVRRFSWVNLSLFLLVNVFVLLPGVIVYLVFCISLAVHHFSDGFMALRWEGLTVQARRYVRADGKTIQLVPMAHVGDSDFYHRLSQSFPTNSIILMEGVSDRKHLLTNGISYKKMAAVLGVVEQHEEFVPRGTRVRADVDVEQFATNTIDFLNLVMGIHSKGLTPETLLTVSQVAPPGFEQQLFDDLLRKRNQHVIEEINSRLPQSDNLIVPWGAAHIPGIAKEILKAGFRLQDTRDYVVIRFRSSGNHSVNKREEGDEGKSN